MAPVARSFTRLASQATPRASTVRAATSSTSCRAFTRENFQTPFRRSYASGPSANGGYASARYLLGALALAGGGGAYYFSQGEELSKSKKPAKEAVSSASSPSSPSSGAFTPNKDAYQKVYNAIAERLEEKDDYDDGSYGPVIVRLAWHCSGTYDKDTQTGGSNGATMRFAPEGDHGANAGLKAARDFLEPVKHLWTLAGVCAIQEMQGPVIPWRPGRSDRDASMCTPDGRLPDGAKEQSHLRAIFGRMGFDDREIVALSGAHALGRCHTDRSGFDGPWSFSPTVMSNDYFRLLVDQKWNFRKWDGPKQYQDLASKSLMMLPTDMALIKDKEFKKHVERYAADDKAFFAEFREVVMKLLELGVPFQSRPEDRMELKPLSSE
ncbi:MAG: hypothetical protein Q9174_000834 [Haloplaca sp. 1 TL-2023]